MRDGDVYFGTGSDCVYTSDPETLQRRRAQTADVEGMAALCERLPNMDFVMTMGWPEDVPWEVGQLTHVVALLKGTRKPLRRERVGGAEWCGA